MGLRRLGISRLGIWSRLGWILRRLRLRPSLDLQLSRLRIWVWIPWLLPSVLLFRLQLRISVSVLRRLRLLELLRSADFLLLDLLVSRLLRNDNVFDPKLLHFVGHNDAVVFANGRVQFTVGCLGDNDLRIADLFAKLQHDANLLIVDRNLEANSDSDHDTRHDDTRRSGPISGTTGRDQPAAIDAAYSAAGDEIPVGALGISCHSTTGTDFNDIGQPDLFPDCRLHERESTCRVCPGIVSLLTARPAGSTGEYTRGLLILRQRQKSVALAASPPVFIGCSDRNPKRRQ